MQTTGTVLLNARGVNINGYDCFVNLSQYSKDLDMVATHGHPQSWFPAFNEIPTVIKIDSTNVKFSNTSLYLQNTVNTYISTPTYSNTCDYTISFWAYQKIFNEVTSSMPYYNNRGNLTAILMHNSSIFQSSNSNLNPQTITANLIIGGDNNYNVDISSKNLYLMDKWTHFAFTCRSGVFRMFLDGIKVLEHNNPTNFGTTKNINIRNLACYGWLDDIVVIEGDCLWDSDFTVPSSYLLDESYNINDKQLRKNNVLSSLVDRELIFMNDVFKQY